MITTAKYENEDQTKLTATIDGQEWSGITEASPFWSRVLEWVAEGNTIEPYVPPVVVPSLPPIHRASFWLAALSLGVLKSDILSKIMLNPNLEEREYMRIMVEETQFYQRTDPLITQFATMYHITSEQLDTLWLWAANN